jgi:hypothetical protein
MRRAFLALIFALSCGCSVGHSQHRAFYVCVGTKSEQSLFNLMSETTTQLGYWPSTGTATDDRGNVTTVMRASGWTTDVWLENAVTFPKITDPMESAYVVPSHRQFYVSIDGLPFARERMEATDAFLRSRLMSTGYQVFNDDRGCKK